MVAFPNQRLHEIHNNSFWNRQGTLIFWGIFLAGVNFESVYVATIFAQHKAFYNKPLLRGIYCLNARRPFHKRRDSSIEVLHDGVYTSPNFSQRWSNRGRILKSLSGKGASAAGIWVLSLKCRNFDNNWNLFLVIIAPNKGMKYRGSLYQYKWKAGFRMIPVWNNSPRNCLISFGSVGYQSFTRDLLLVALAEMNCSAKRFVSATK